MSATPDFQAVIDLQLEQLSQGEIVFNPPLTVRAGDKTRVQARISRQAGNPDLIRGLKGPGVPQLEPIKVGRFMGAELSGDGLSVMELSSKTQLVDDDQPSQWDWEVTGTSPGKRALHLHVWIRIQAPPLPEQIKDLPVLDREVEVQVNPSYQAMQFLLGNWQWLLGSGFSASFVAFIWKIRVTFESKRHARRCFLYRRCKS